MAYKFSDVLSPSFSGDFEERLRDYGEGLTVIRSDQCPYVDAASNAVKDVSEEKGIGMNMIELKRSEDVRRFSPSPYGVFSIVYNGRLVSYHSVARKELTHRLRARSRASARKI